MTAGFRSIFFASVALLVVGCGNVENEPIAGNVKVARYRVLEALASGYDAYCDVHGYGPARARDLDGYTGIGEKEIEIAALAQIENGELVMNARISRGAAMKKGGLHEIPLFWERGISQAGGYASFFDHTSKKLTSAEFAALPKGDDVRMTDKDIEEAKKAATGATPRTKGGDQ